MIKITPSSKIFVHCPAGIVTGGAELLHQLVHNLNNNKHNAFIVYYGSAQHSLPSDYRDYNVKIAEEIENDKDNIEVIIEGCFNLIHRHSETQKVLWWISVDNFYRCSVNYLNPLDEFKYDYKLGIKSLIIYLKNYLRGNKTAYISLSKLKKMDVVNAYQSEYAQNFLQNQGFKEIIALKDYINVDHCHNIDTAAKENIILYNPKKGFKFTSKLMRLAPNLKWIPIEKMSRSEVISLMHRAKLYIDFGFHPGKDRLPRECAMNGCCIITGSKGSANFFEDVMIPNKYKFNEDTAKLSDIIERVKWVLENYETAYQDFKMYREMISQEKREFEEQINFLFKSR